MEMFQESNENLRKRFDLTIRKGSFFEYIYLTGFEYRCSSDNSSKYREIESGADLWVPWKLMKPTDEDRNIAVPRWFVLKELRNNPALAGVIGHRGPSDRLLIDEWLTEHEPEVELAAPGVESTQETCERFDGNQWAA
jgi:hypothetical protein